ncbi:MAG: hypothetical protein SGI73_20530 [Chloroflexota bacterium]|nr:hypothetical protein [Chloroflexota bacterium]
MTEYHDALPPHIDDNAASDASSAPKKPLEAFAEHQKRAFEETGKALESLLPPGFREHGDTARKEFLKGMKVLVDAAVVELEKAGKEVDKAFKRTRDGQAPPPPAADDRPSSTGKTKVKVQVD